MGTTNDRGGPAPGKRPESKKTGTIAVATIFVVAAIAVAATHTRKNSAGVDDAVNTGVLGVPSQTPPGEVAAGPPKPKHPPRRLEDTNRKELETTLPKGTPVEITAPKGDDEAFMLAQEIRAFLHAQNYPVGDVKEHAPDPSAKGVGLEPLPDGKWRVIVGAAD